MESGQEFLDSMQLHREQGTDPVSVLSSEFAVYCRLGTLTSNLRVSSQEQVIDISFGSSVFSWLSNKCHHEGCVQEGCLWNPLRRGPGVGTRASEGHLLVLMTW